jgi:hypothetical protein
VHSYINPATHNILNAGGDLSSPENRKRLFRRKGAEGAESVYFIFAVERTANEIIVFSACPAAKKYC